MFGSHLDDSGVKLMKKIELQFYVPNKKSQNNVIWIYVVFNFIYTICSRHDIAEIQIKWRYTPINQSIISFLSKMTSSVDIL
jgi:hypothetical protein